MPQNLTYEGGEGSEFGGPQQVTCKQEPRHGRPPSPGPPRVSSLAGLLVRATPGDSDWVPVASPGKDSIHSEIITGLWQLQGSPLHLPVK